MSDNDVNHDSAQFEQASEITLAEKITEADRARILESAKEKVRAACGPVRPDVEKTIDVVEQPLVGGMKEENAYTRRPPFTKNINVRMDEDTYRRLREYERKNHLSSDSAVIRMFLLRGLDSEDA